MRGRQLNLRKQGGYATLIGLLLAIAASAALIPIAAREFNARLTEEKAASEADQLAQFSVGLRGFVAAVQGNPSLMPSSAKTGVKWLQPTSCGGTVTSPANGYLPCSFSGGTYGSLYSTTFTRDAATNLVTARTSIQVPAGSYEKAVRRQIASRMIGMLSNRTQPGGTGLFVQAFANAPSGATSQPRPQDEQPADQGRVELVVSNAPSNDIYLRTDGTNKMLADLNMDGHDLRNARDIEVSGTVKAKDFRATGSAQIDGGLYVGGGLESDTLRVNGDTSVKNLTVESGGDVWMEGNTTYLSAGMYFSTVLQGARPEDGYSYMVEKPKCQMPSQPRIYAAVQDTGQSLNPISRLTVDVADVGSSWRVTPVIEEIQYGLSLVGTKLTLDAVKTNYGGQKLPQMKILVQAKCS